jgi:hypothetical protein
MIKLVLFDKIGGFSCRYPQDPDGYEHEVRRCLGTGLYDPIQVQAALLRQRETI